MLSKLEVQYRDPNELYKIIRPLGKGGSGSVYLAQHRETGDMIALKRVYPSDLEEKNMIMNEIALTMSTKHPNIMNYFDTYETSDSIWMVVEVMEGCLYELIAQRAGNIPEKQIAFICHEILQGLKFVHRQHRIHRDMKSDNVLINSNGDIKLGDFGFAAQLTTEKQQRNTIVGTPAWMAPELIEGSGYDEKVDIWSFGIIAIELADGNPPYLKDPPMKALYKIVSSPPPTVSRPEKWSSEFNDFIHRSLQKNIAIRPSANELLDHAFFALHIHEHSKDEYTEFLRKWRPKVKLNN